MKAPRRMIRVDQGPTITVFILKSNGAAKSVITYRHKLDNVRRRRQCFIANTAEKCSTHMTRGLKKGTSYPGMVTTNPSTPIRITSAHTAARPESKKQGGARAAVSTS